MNATSDAAMLPARKPGALLRTSGIVLSIAGLIWCLPSAVPIVHDIFILRHAGRYRPAALEVDQIRFAPPGSEGGAVFEGHGTIDGEPVGVPLHEFVGISSGLLAAFAAGGRMPETFEEAEQMVPPGTTLQILYWPEGPDMTIGAVNLRAFRLREEFPESFRDDLLFRDLPICAGPLLAGLTLWFFGRRTGRRSADSPGPNV